MRRLCWSVVLVLSLPALGWGQTTTISGTLTDEVTGNPLGNPPSEAYFGVTVYGAEGQFLATTFTSLEGTYLVAVPPGTYFSRPSGN